MHIATSTMSTTTTNCVICNCEAHHHKNGRSTENPIGCRACGYFPSYEHYGGPLSSNQNRAYTIKLIENTVRVPSSEYTMNKSALNVYVSPKLNPQKSLYGVNWNQMSDRAVPGVLQKNVPSHGNSTRSSLTRMRPGSTSAAGKGVDIKHGSYDRYLARLKGKSVLRTSPATNPLNSKSINWGIAYSYDCTTLDNCNPNDNSVPPYNPVIPCLPIVLTDIATFSAGVYTLKNTQTIILQCQILNINLPDNQYLEIGSGQTFINNGTVNIIGNGVHIKNNHTFNNNGTINITPLTFILNQYLFWNSGGIINIKNEGEFYNDDGATLNNVGIINVTSDVTAIINGNSGGLPSVIKNQYGSINMSSSIAISNPTLVNNSNGIIYNYNNGYINLNSSSTYQNNAGILNNPTDPNSSTCGIGHLTGNIFANGTSCPSI